MERGEGIADEKEEGRGEIVVGGGKRGRRGKEREVRGIRKEREIKETRDKEEEGKGSTKCG